MEKREKEGCRRRVIGLIEKATKSTAREVDPRLLKAIKSVVRYSDMELQEAAGTLMELMKREHSQVRFLTLLIIDELFMRSKLFRTLMVEDLDQLLSLAVGFRRNLPLPAPPAIATLLRSKAIEFLEKWNSSFGFHYRKLRLGFDYLKNTLKFQFPNLQANAARIQRERQEREMRTKEILRNKFESLRENFLSIKVEIDETIREIKECLEIFQEKGDDGVPLAFLDEEDFVEFRSSQLRQIRLDSLKESEKVQETSENRVLFDALREQHKLLVTKHLVSVQDWISVLIRVELADNRMRDSMLKEFIDIRNNILAIKKKCEEAGFAIRSATSHEKDEKTEEEDFWEEGEGKVGSESSNDVASMARNQHDEDSFIPSSGEAKKCTSESKSSEALSRKDATSRTASLRDKLLSEAPVVKWGSQLNNWDSSTEILANHRGLDLESHWGRVDQDAVIPAEKIAELNLQATLYKEERGEIQPCRAPLKKGSLCPRRDLRICPFHGPIIPRDDKGNPISQEPSLDESFRPSSSAEEGVNLDLPMNETISDTGHDQLAERIAKQAVKNVREKDKAAMRKRVIEKQSAKRAKRAKVREHNESVLRDAALASTSRSAVIDDLEFDRLAMARNKKETLSSMVRKKVTARDRLAKRLQSSRTKGKATQQLTQGEDEKYREAFPNQW